MSNVRNERHNEVLNVAAYIDLTTSPAQNVPLQRNGFSDSVIETLEDSFIDLTCSPEPSRLLYRQSLLHFMSKNNEEQGMCSGARQSKIEKSTSNHIGACPICFDEYGTRPLTSTICGHVYCSKCLKRVLKSEKKCPTCRRKLNGHTDCHPLYLQSH